MNARSISISLGAGPVNISHSQEIVTISGSKQKLNVLAENILWLADQDEGFKASEITNHIHVEYHPGHFYLAETRFPWLFRKMTRREKKLFVRISNPSIRADAAPSLPRLEAK